MLSIKLNRTLIGAGLALFALASLGLTPAYATLSANARYTISIEAVQSNGAVTTGPASLNLSSPAATDSSGKLTFTLSGVPSSTQYNFLVITITDSAGSIVRRSVMPAPTPGTRLNLGVSEVTENQSGAFLKAFQTAGTDDPLLAFFGFLLVRSSDITDGELLQMANFCLKGIKGTDGTGTTTGFEAYLRSKGGTDADLLAFRQNIVTNLNAFASLYKDSIDQYFSAGANSELEKRGEAAGKLFEYLVQAADDVGIDSNLLLMAFNKMGAVVMPLMTAAVNSGEMRASVQQGIETTISRGMEKLRADKFLAAYTAALTALGASAAELERFNVAATTLKDTMSEQFQDFEKTVMKDSGVDASTASDFDTEMGTAMQTAFSLFMSNVAATDAEILDLRTRMATALGTVIGNIPASQFKFRDSLGAEVNWPIMMVVASRWGIGIMGNSAQLTYTRDNLGIPAAMAWLGGNRTDFRTPFSGLGLNLTLPIMYEIRQDVEIAEFAKYAAYQAIDWTNESTAMDSEATAQENFYNRLALITSKIGKSGGTSAITDAEKDALVTIFVSPSF